MYKMGSLLSGLEFGLIADYGVVLNHETTPDRNERISSQVRVLKAAVTRGRPIWIIEQDGIDIIDRDSNDVRKYSKTNEPLLDVVKDHHRSYFIQNVANNVFHDTCLEDLVRSAKIDTLVVMGDHANSCVRLSVVGGTTHQKGGKPTVGVGAVQRGFKVLTTNLIVNNSKPSDTDWFGAVGVSAYRNL